MVSDIVALNLPSLTTTTKARLKKYGGHYGTHKEEYKNTGVGYLSDSLHFINPLHGRNDMTCATKTHKTGDPIIVIENGRRVIVDADVASNKEIQDYCIAMELNDHLQQIAGERQ